MLNFLYESENALVVALVVALLAFISAWIIHLIARKHKFKDERTELSSKIVFHFTHYVDNWRRLMSISELKQKSGKQLPEFDKVRFERYIKDRDKAKSELVSCINILPLYFDKKINDEFLLFKKWDNSQSKLRLPELPPIEEWERWQEKLCTLLNQYKKQ